MSGWKAGNRIDPVAKRRRQTYTFFGVNLYMPDIEWVHSQVRPLSGSRKEYVMSIKEARALLIKMALEALAKKKK